jgi:hypothetical protein
MFLFLEKAKAERKAAKLDSRKGRKDDDGTETSRR